MDLKMKVILLLFLLGFAAARTTSAVCCDKCTCTRSIPPECTCDDVKPTCHSNCKSCRCFETLPLKCDCLDITDFCYEPCTNNSTIIAN
jgi:hypothetical protein